MGTSRLPRLPQTVDSRLQSGPLRLQRWVTQVRRGAPDLDTVGQRGHGGGQEGHGVRRDDEGPPCLRTDATALGDKATHGSDPGVRRGVDVRGERSPLDGTRHGGTPDEAGEGGMLSQRPSVAESAAAIAVASAAMSPVLS